MQKKGGIARSKNPVVDPLTFEVFLSNSIATIGRSLSNFGGGVIAFGTLRYEI